ncbi:MAG: SMODS domain-containing nucleotidyltransferase [Bacteroidia bacterium]
MLDDLILEKAALHSYNQAELNNIAATSNHLRSIIANKEDFNDSLIGGSFKRGTQVKGISDVDVYFQYSGSNNSSMALGNLKRYLIESYPTSDVKRDKPSILVDFEKIPFNITPFKRDHNSVMQIPNVDLFSWRPIDLSILEKGINLLKAKNPKYIDLIKILKLWNRNYDRKLKNFNIEERVLTLFLPTGAYHQQNISDWLLLFFKNYAFHNDSVKFVDLKYSKAPENQLKPIWLKFIDNK